MSGAGPVAIVRHADGTAVQVGDQVLIEHGRTPGIVEMVIVEPNDIAEFNVGEAGVMLLSRPFWRVFWPLDCPEDPVIFVERGSIPASC